MNFSHSKCPPTLKKITLVVLKPDLSLLKNNVDPDQLASDEVIYSGSILFSTHACN